MPRAERVAPQPLCTAPGRCHARRPASPHRPSVRRLYGENSACPKVIFAEHVPGDATLSRCTVLSQRFFTKPASSRINTPLRLPSCSATYVCRSSRRPSAPQRAWEAGAGRTGWRGRRIRRAASCSRGRPGRAVRGRSPTSAAGPPRGRSEAGPQEEFFELPGPRPWSVRRDHDTDRSQRCHYIRRGHTLVGRPVQDRPEHAAPPLHSPPPGR